MLVRAPGPSTTQPRVHFEARHLRFWGLEESSAVDEVTTSVELDLSREKFYMLRKLRADTKTYAALQEVAMSTYVPASMAFVRLGPDREADNYIRREDAQKLACALLEMDWHPNGYLVRDMGKSPLGLTMLRQISARDVPLLSKLSDNIQHLGINADERAKFSKAAEYFFKKSSNNSKTLYELELVLKSMQHDVMEVNLMICILMLTNDEFGDLVYQSARQIQLSSSSQIAFDLRQRCQRTERSIRTIDPNGVFWCFGSNERTGMVGRTELRTNALLEPNVRLFGCSGLLLIDLVWGFCPNWWSITLFCWSCATFL
ncbi:hypothetical protein BU23DRAFT_647135 [Bimuria novae-zelandiae CBS 107.79]|uniref:Uncharacterized protein n=1 Tax=Bimuria novae-zelandiae CBS 107.79 TaxID=1447943 RepID=A0A6A5VQ75_9PLEO|nr:hypothetical protein BU23DRAFT_647135 [Bimuria novae-zelandiae CBS 107.79]